MQEVVGGVGIIFYAGHGMQYEGINYLIPTSVKLEDDSDLNTQCTPMNSVMSVLRASNKSLNVLLLDACRTLPSFSRDSGQGWTKENAPRGSIVVFATEAGKVASDGDGKNGLFTSKLLSRIQEPGLSIRDLIQKVKEDVVIESKGKQFPSSEDMFIGSNFYFTPSSDNSSAIVPVESEIESNRIPPVLNNIFFSAKMDALPDGSMQQLQKAVDFLFERPESKLEIRVFFDPRAPMSVAHYWNEKCINLVRDFLNSHGIDNSKLTTYEYAFQDPNPIIIEGIDRSAINNIRIELELSKLTK